MRGQSYESIDAGRRDHRRGVVDRQDVGTSGLELLDQGGADGFLDDGLRPWLLEEACNNAGIDLTLRMQDGYNLLLKKGFTLGSPQMLKCLQAAIRFCKLFNDGKPEPSQAARLATEKLRGAGLSNNKTLAIHDLAEKSVDGTLANPRRLAGLDDDSLFDDFLSFPEVGEADLRRLTRWLPKRRSRSSESVTPGSEAPVVSIAFTGMAGTMYTVSPLLTNVPLLPSVIKTIFNPSS